MNGWWIALIVYGCGFVITTVWIVVATRGNGQEMSYYEPGDEDVLTGILIFCWPILWSMEFIAMTAWVVKHFAKRSTTSQNLATANKHRDA